MPKTRQQLLDEMRTRGTKTDAEIRATWTAEEERIHDSDVSDADLQAIQFRLNNATPAETGTIGYKLLLKAWNAFQYHRDNGNRHALKQLQEPVKFVDLPPLLQ